MKDSSKIHLLIGFIGSSLLCVAYTLYAGKDQNADFFHYHLYAAQLAVGRDLGQDLFAAGAQSYLNPYAHALTYLFTQSSIPSHIGGALLACVHSINVWLCWQIAVLCMPLPESDRKFKLLICAATLLAVWNPLFLALLGTTFTDISTSVFALAAIAASLKFLSVESATAGRWAVYGGAFGGMAVALKMSNIFLVLPLTLVVLFRRATRKENTKYISLLVGGQLVGYLMLNGYWMYILWENTGNPFYPFFNQYFDYSSSMPILESRHERFLTNDWVSLLAMPFLMALPLRGVYVEIAAPDVRYAGLFCFLIGAGMIWLRQKMKRQPQETEDIRELKALTVVFAIGWLMWLVMSSNGRYIFPLTMLCGVLLVGWGVHLSRRSLRGVGYLSLLLVLVQFVQFCYMPSPRWASEHWGKAWHSVNVPEQLKKNSALYLGTEYMSVSWLLNDIHPESAMIQISGGQAVGLDGRGSKRLSQLIEKWNSRIKLVAKIPRRFHDRNLDQSIVEDWATRVHHLGLNVKGLDHCMRVTLEESFNRGLEPDQAILSSAQVSESGPFLFASFGPATWDRREEYAVCDLVQDSIAEEMHRAERQTIDRIFDAVEAWCPAHFKPAMQRSQKRDKANWVRVFSSTDVDLVLSHGNLRFRDEYKLAPDFLLGSGVDWLQKNNVRPPCPPRLSGFQFN